MGLFDKFKKKNEAEVAVPEQQPTAENVVQTNIAQAPVAEQMQQPQSVPETLMVDNPFMETPSVELVEDKIAAPTAPNFDNIFNAQPADLIATSSQPSPQPEPDLSNVVPNMYDTGAKIDEPKPIVEQQIALNVNPDEVFEGGNTK